MESESDFFVRCRKFYWIMFYITFLSWEFLLKWHNFLWTFCWNRIFAVYHDFQSVLVSRCYKILDSQTSFTSCWLSGVGVGNFGKVGVGSQKFWKGRSWSRTFYLRLRNPDYKFSIVIAISTHWTISIIAQPKPEKQCTTNHKIYFDSEANNLI